ncbi:MAG: cytochrome c oxidase subunit I [Gemmatimonadota bacterium]|jgi:cytochrome c oxidase subunit 1|nr:cytochrome c oxidase subunit I [Gemmatimonadota bacterium]
MAATQTLAAPVPAIHAPQGGIKSWIMTVDHKKIGILYFWTSFFFFLVGGLEALMVRTQLIVPDNNFISADFYNQMFSMHAVTMVFLALMPLTAAFFNFIIPLQIGARDVAFPRLNALSFWIYFFGGIFINIGFLLGPSLPNVGWFAYANLTRPEFSPGLNVDFYVTGLQILGLSSIISAINFIVTILNLRAPGMRLMRMPIFTWMTLITGVLLATAMAVITIALTQLMFDRFFGTVVYDTTAGGDPVLWQHLFWMFGHPEVYILILPVFGMVSEVIPTFSRKPLFGYNVMVFSGILIGWLGWGVWSHHMFAVGLGPIADSFFSISTMLIAIPTGIKIFNWLATLWGGSIRFTASMMFATFFLVTFTIGGISGIMHASAPADLQQTDTYFVVAHLHYVFFGGTVMGLWAAIYFWFPKLFGRLMNETLGHIHFWFTFIGMNLTFFPMHFLGLHGMPRRTFTYQAGLGFEQWNMVSTIGSYLIAVGTLIFAWNLVTSARRGRISGPNPWGASTLEWSIPSPPAEYNFRHIPVVRSRMPLWETDPVLGEGVPHGAAAEDTADVELFGSPVVEAELPDEESQMSAHDLGIHLPPPSILPILLAFALSAFFGGFVLYWGIPVVAGLGIAVLIYAFAFEPGHSGH